MQSIFRVLLLFALFGLFFHAKSLTPSVQLAVAPVAAKIGKTQSLSGCQGTTGMCDILLRDTSDITIEPEVGKGTAWVSTENRLTFSFDASMTPLFIRETYLEQSVFTIPQPTSVPAEIMSALGRAGQTYIISPGNYLINRTDQQYVIVF